MGCLFLGGGRWREGECGGRGDAGQKRKGDGCGGDELGHEALQGLCGSVAGRFGYCEVETDGETESFRFQVTTE